MSQPRVANDYKDKFPIWCPGCGDFQVLGALQKAAAELNLDPDRTVLVTGIGCSGLITSSFRTYGFHGVHGRALPAATGVKMSDPSLTVLVAGGDGDGYGIGMGHLVHAARRNVDVTYIVMDNQTYGLTKGQVSPTTDAGIVTKTTPAGNPEHPVEPLALALLSGTTYLASAFSGDTARLTEIVVGAVQHKGFSLVNIQSPCITYNKDHMPNWYKERLRTLDDEAHDPTDMRAALDVVLARDGRIPNGVIYRGKKPALHDLVRVGKNGVAPTQEALGQTLTERAKDLQALRDAFA